LLHLAERGVTLLKRLFVLVTFLSINFVEASVSESAAYIGAGAVFGSAAILGQLASHIAPKDSALGNECLLFSYLCASGAHDIFAHLFNDRGQIPSSLHSWRVNRQLLSVIKANSVEEKRLLHFLENRWLSKATGYFPIIVNWVYPCFGVSVQTNPLTSQQYARDPSVKISLKYQEKLDSWKKILPHPQHFPLILTRPGNIESYLPSQKTILDLTPVFEGITDPQEWLLKWNTYQKEIEHLNPSKTICIQRVRQDEIGGLRILPLATSSTQKVNRDHRFLLKWISKFGLSANLIELDRPLISPPIDPAPTSEAAAFSRQEFISFLNTYDHKISHPQKALFQKGTLNALRGLFKHKERWDEVMQSSTKASIAEIAFKAIKKELQLLVQEGKELSFFDTASHIELIHASLTELLEISSPYKPEDFAAIYQNALHIPEKLKAFTSYAVHSSGMTSMGGIFKAVEKTLGRAPHILYGENTYFECIHIAEKIGKALSISDSTEQDWKQVDLIIAQFNPALKRIHLAPTQYCVEKVASSVHKALSSRKGKPLTLALDCTFDFIDSPRVKSLLNEFEDEIKEGVLNVVCFRSGLKFDLFGMDNYAGAPLYMVHKPDPKWAAFDALLTDPVFQADSLSLNWFCLAYENVAPQLEQYRKQIFDNTRALLDKMPERLFNPNSRYRVVFFEPDTDAAFIDIKISGALHEIRGAALAGGCLALRCMERGHPVFFRPSVGFYHPNFTVLFNKDNTTIRLTLGLDPAQVDVLADCFEIIDTLNGAPQEKLRQLISKSYCKMPAHALASP
jgi:hypothetical protein